MTLEGVSARVEELTRRVHEVEKELANNRPIVLATQIHNLEDDVRGLSGEVRGLRRAVIGFALTVAVSAIVLALTVVFSGSP